MGKMWDGLKILVVIVVIMLVLRVVFATEIFGNMPWEYVIVVVAIIVVVAVVYLLKWYPIRKIVKTGVDDSKYEEKIILKMLASNRRIPAVIADGRVLKYPPGTEGQRISDHYWMRFIDTHPEFGKVSTNIFFDIINDSIRGVIYADDLHCRPSERIVVATRLLQLLKSGELPSTVILPQTVEKIVQESAKSEDDKET